MRFVMQISAVGEGQAIVVIGLLALLFWAVTRFQSLTGTVIWGITVLIYAGVIGLQVPREYFHLALIFTIVVVILAGAVYWGSRI